MRRTRPLPFTFSVDSCPSGAQTGRKGRPRTSRIVGFSALSCLALIGCTYLGIHQLPWFGPWLADTLRQTIGSANVTLLEEASASAEDRLRLATTAENVRTLAQASANVPVTSEVLRPSANEPTAVGPLFHAKKSPADGTWQKVATRVEGTSLHLAMLHPDPERGYAELFIYAIDLALFDVSAVAGSSEPAAPSAKKTSRPGVVPQDERATLVAAFNGGFKAEHGHYGMMSEGTEWLAPKPNACTFAVRNDGSPLINTWSKVATERDSMKFFRQTPPCMLEDGKLHPGLAASSSKGWGATIDGDTVIRRSALGLSSDRRTLYYAMSNATTARALALGMQHIGATNVAQLDVNHSYPRFLIYRGDESTKLTATTSVEGLLYREDEYLGRASSRDFFYITAK